MRLLDSQLYLTSLFKAEKDLRPVSLKHSSCATIPRSPVLSATSLVQEKREKRMALKHSLNKSI